ncbi:MAG: efflux RND transporter permease subunit [Pseudomonadota bacterium]
MWIVRLALRRPYTVGVMCSLVLVLGVLSLSRMTVDILPAIHIPVVIVVWNYPGLAAEDMERRVVLISERAYSTTINGISRIESQCIQGTGILKVYFQPGSDLGTAISQITSVSNTVLRMTPPGMQPPSILQFDASNVPVAQMTVSSKTMTEQALFDYGLNFIRVRLFTIPGLSTPPPFGGRMRQIMVDIDADALASRGVSPGDVVAALQSSNVILPAGTARIGDTEYNVLTNAGVDAVDHFKTIPIKVVGGRPVFIGDVARVSDSFAEQTNIVRIDGQRATYLAILKHADASTLAVVEATREVLPSIMATAPQGLELKIDFDQSVFVIAAIEGVMRETVLASLLVSVMILIFLGSWRSMVIVIISIPLALLTSIIGLKLTGNTINLMTLGGLALAVGMLVDDATVEVENIHRNRAMGKTLTIAILDGAGQVAVPAIVATLSICIVFFPVVLLYGPARFLFTPMALAVVIAMLASYLLSRTLVPTLSRMLMPSGDVQDDSDRGNVRSTGRVRNLALALNRMRDYYFDRFRESYARSLHTVLQHPRFSIVIAGLLFLISLGLVFFVGTDFFPSVDPGIMKLHFRAPIGTRLERTEELVAQVENKIREIIPREEIQTINSMIGVPIFINLAFVQTDNIGGMDADILIALKSGHRPTSEYRKKIREALHRDFPDAGVYFQAADIITLVLNFGLTSPIEVQIEDRDMQRGHELAVKLKSAMAEIPGLEDIHIVQVFDYPAFQLDIDRTRAAYLGMSERDVAKSVLISLASSSLIAPSYFVNPHNNVNYTVAVQIPIRNLDSLDSLRAVPITPPTPADPLQQASTTPLAGCPQAPAQPLANLANIYNRVSAANISHYTIQRIVSIGATLEDLDLGWVSKRILEKIKGLGELPPGTSIRLRGQYEVMSESFRSLALGLILAAILVYLLMVMLFQSWLDPFIIMAAVPGAFAGILWMLALTGTTINVESLMGTIMAVGIATSNSILLVSFANDLRVEHGLSATEAALEAAKIRLKPVLMTALAMILGMLPMALALGEAGEQNAPLGRAVIGGLVVATVVTLFIVPTIYSLLRKDMPTKYLLEQRFLAEATGKVLKEERHG